MNLLAFDTSTEIFSVAVQRGDGGGHGLLEQSGAGGAQASAALIPAIQGLLARAGLTLSDLDAIVIGRGPGSFTGVRTACSVAQGLAFGVGVPVLAIDTLMAVAEDAHWRAAVTEVVAVLDARMDEVYWAHYVHDADAGRWTRQGGFALGRPESVVIPPRWTLVGNAFSACGERWPSAVHIDALPTAAALLRLAPALLADGQGGPAAAALPLYIRDKVAQTTEERAALRRAAASRT